MTLIDQFLIFGTAFGAAVAAYGFWLAHKLRQMDREDEARMVARDRHPAE